MHGGIAFLESILYSLIYKAKVIYSLKLQAHRHPAKADTEHHGFPLVKFLTVAISDQ